VGLSQPTGVAADSAGNVFLAFGNVVAEVDTNGIYTRLAGSPQEYEVDSSGDGGPATNALLGAPDGVAVDNLGNLYIADADSLDRIRKIDTNGIITTVAINLYSPESVAANTNGDLVFADEESNAVFGLKANGSAVLVAGNGVIGFPGDGGAATNASLWTPRSLALDGTGGLLVGDVNNNRVRRITLTDQPQFTLHNVSPASAGNYQVVVRNPFGNVTSAVASLTISPPGILMTEPLVSGGILLVPFNITQWTNVSYSLLQAASITGPWAIATNASLSTNPVVGGFQFSLPLPVSTEFFQVRSL
jgi:hypothetical protein